MKQQKLTILEEVKSLFYKIRAKLVLFLFKFANSR